MAQQVKSKQRVADHGEVFTAEREVKAMVDLVWKNFKDDRKKIEATFLEPTCGSGNFLVEILERKLKIVLKFDKKEKSQTEFEKNLIKAIASIYGIELLQDNARECRKRLRHLVLKYYPEPYRKGGNYSKMLKNIIFIFSKNIICGDALKFIRTDTQKERKIMVIEWIWEQENIKTKLYSLFEKVNYNYKTNSVPRVFKETKPKPYLYSHLLQPEISKKEKEKKQQKNIVEETQLPLF